MTQAQRIALALICVASGCNSIALAQREPSLVNLGGTILRSLSADGNAGCGVANQASAAVRWTRTGGVQVLPRLTGYNGGRPPRAYDISWDGRVVCGATSGTSPRVAWKWVLGAGTLPLPDLDGSTENGYAEFISGNGQVIVGNSYGPNGLEAVRWTDAGIEIMPSTAGVISVILLINFDGERMVTLNAASGTVALRDSSFRVVADLSSSSLFSPYGISASGDHVVGSIQAHAVRWTANEGFSSIPGAAPLSFARAISADARVIAGYDVNPERAWIWGAHHGIRYVDALILEQIGSLPTSMAVCEGMSADGQTLLLRGSDGNRYVLQLRGGCGGDVDDGTMSGGRDDVVNVDDLTAFLVWMGEGNLLADVDNGSGAGIPDLAVTIDDLLHFLRGFEAGC